MQFGGIQARKKTEKNFQYLPFYCCSLSLQPFSHPACTPEGIIFDLRYDPPAKDGSCISLSTHNHV